MRDELLKMGLVPEDATEKKMVKYAKHIVFTSALCDKLGLTCVVPVFCVEERASNSIIHEMKVRLPTPEEVQAATDVLGKAKEEAEKNAKKKKESV